MGGGQSTPSAPPAPQVIQDPYPAQVGLTNLSLAPGTTAACIKCDIGVDARATTSSITLTRDFGNISDTECQRYETDLAAVRNKELSFRDFFNNLQAGRYSRPVSKNNKGQAFCEQLLFAEDDAAKVTDLASFESNKSKLKGIRIRQVTGGGSFSSGTKAKFKLSIPLKVTYVSQIEKVNKPLTRLKLWPPRWETVPGPERITPGFRNISISTMTMYHPSPLRIENVQHDAVLSLNDPSDPNADAIILIPLKASNTNDESVDFFTKICRYLPTIMEPDSVTGLYSESNIPTGNDWSIKQVFWLGEAGSDNMSMITDAFFTWTGAGTYSRSEVWRTTTEIRYGWKPEGKQIRYFMLQNPVSISTSDLSFLTRSLPPTPATEAIHVIPDPATAGVPKVLYKQATGPGASAGCGVVRERMSNKGQGDMIASLFTGGGTEELLVDEKGSPLSDKDSCDPFKMNAKRATAAPSLFTPTRAASLFFNFMIVIAIAIGAWLAMFFVTNKDYDYSFKNFSDDAGKVLGTLALQTSGRMKENTFGLSRALPSLPGLPTAKGEIPTEIPGLPKDLSGLPKGLSGLTSLLSKKSLA
jgi:hypothetical protein